jgi:hypothetical protein
MTPPRPLRLLSTDRPRPTGRLRLSGLRSLGPYIRRSTSFYFLTLFPDQFPNQAGTHDDVLIIGRLFNLSVVHIRTPSYDPWQDRCLSGLCHRSTLTSDFTPNVYSRPSTKYLQTGGCPRLLTSNLYHPPIASTTHLGSLQGVGAWYTYLSSTGRRHIHMQPFRVCTLA